MKRLQKMVEEQTIPQFGSISRAMKFLEEVKHWRVQCHNSAGKPRRYECCLWWKSRRETATSGTPLDAINAAIVKILDPKRSESSAPITEFFNTDDFENIDHVAVAGRINPEQKS